MYINNIEFAINRKSLKGEIEISQLKRASDLFNELSGKLSFNLLGNLDTTETPILNVKIYGKICTLCQNCLEPITIDINHDWSVAVFNNESDLGAALFGEDEVYNDGILKSEEFNVLDFIEDEIIMLLPVSPKHDSCNSLTYKDDSLSPFRILKQ